MPNWILISLSLTQITFSHGNMWMGCDSYKLWRHQSLETDQTTVILRCTRIANYKPACFTKYEVLSGAAAIKNVVSWHVTPCSPVGIRPTIQRTCCLRPLGKDKNLFYPKDGGSRFPETLLIVYETTPCHTPNTITFTYAFIREPTLQTKFFLIILQQHQTSN
jgi:hypothetical protein